MEVGERPDGLVVINDAYNANPESVRAALETLAGIGARSGRRTVAVLGEMLELGDGAHDAHRGVGAYAAELGIDVLVAVGPAADAIVEGHDDAGGRGSDDPHGGAGRGRGVAAAQCLGCRCRPGEGIAGGGAGSDRRRSPRGRE